MTGQIIEYSVVPQCVALQICGIQEPACPHPTVYVWVCEVLQTSMMSS